MGRINVTSTIFEEPFGLQLEMRLREVLLVCRNAAAPAALGNAANSALSPTRLYWNAGEHLSVVHRLP